MNAIHELFQHEDTPVPGIDGDKPFCRFTEYRDGGDASVGQPPRTYWALAPDQTGTELEQHLAALSSATRIIREQAEKLGALEFALADDIDALPRHTYGSIAEGMIGKYRDDSGTEYVKLEDVRGLIAPRVEAVSRRSVFPKK